MRQEEKLERQRSHNVNKNNLRLHKYMVGCLRRVAKAAPQSREKDFSAFKKTDLECIINR